MRMRLAAMVLATSIGRASADPSDLVSRPFVLAAGQVEATLTAEINLQLNRYGQPLSVAPDAWVGITDRWTVGVIHGNRSVDRIDASATFCVRQYASRCDHLYRGSGVDVRWGWRNGELAVAPRGRFLIRDIDPVKPAVTAGALVRWTHGRYAITSDPYLRLGLANTDRGNRAALTLPVWFAVQPTCGWLVALHTGWSADFAVVRDGWHVPLGVVIHARATDHIDIVVEAGFTSLLGPQNNIKQRAAMVTVGWRS